MHATPTSMLIMFKTLCASSPKACYSWSWISSLVGGGEQTSLKNVRARKSMDIQWQEFSVVSHQSW